MLIGFDEPFRIRKDARPVIAPPFLQDPQKAIGIQYFPIGYAADPDQTIGAQYSQIGYLDLTNFLL